MFFGTKYPIFGKFLFLRNLRLGRWVSCPAVQSPFAKERRILRLTAAID